MKLYQGIVRHLHVIVLVVATVLILGSTQILIGRSLRANASFWDLLHVYLGLFSVLLAAAFWLYNMSQGRWRQYYPWLVLDFSQLTADVKNLFKGKLPSAGGKGLFSVVEGIGMLLFLATAVTGLLWYIYQGTSDALMWRGYHIDVAYYFVGFICVHMVLACLHIIDFIRQ
ncbi:cytochrome b/b6 domain-containing protein [Shewanella marina]|uniref:cytochrome b/b6 domain-containing protein n=1 Tax=Shewanella marina TaxID=487319 RepID=UPI00046F4588|nr:cytochrome b/b6 domain-containing protein [Shewanella marina]